MERSAANILSTGKWTKLTAWTLAVVLLLMFVIGFWASREPDVFWVQRSADQENAIVGYATVDTLVRVAETLLQKNAGYLTNDKLPPFVVLDNIPSWELGVVNQMRDLGRVMRDDYTRSQSQSKEDPDVAEGSPKFFYDNNSWVFPTTESEYREGIAAFTRYRDRLASGDPNTVFYARADNLREWLSQVEKRLGSLTRRLGNSVARTRINDDLAGDAAAEASGSQPDTVDVRTSWWKTDNIFFEARGTAWALVASDHSRTRSQPRSVAFANDSEWRRLWSDGKSLARDGQLPGQGECRCHQPQRVARPGIVRHYSPRI
jgi:hypothetical protein